MFGTITAFLIGNPLVWQIALMALPTILPNKWIYHLGYYTVGNALMVFTVTQEGKYPKAKGLIAYVINTVSVFLMGVVDRIRKLPPKYDK